MGGATIIPHSLKTKTEILGKNFFDWTIMGGATIIPRSLKTTRNEKNF
jgi:hypothetical protein